MVLPDGFLDELRARVSLADVAARKVTWDRRKSQPSRGDWWAPCPFHQEKTPSFHVKDREGFYYCFGCQAKGDLFKFVQESENVGFMEAVEMLARDAGMEMPERDPRAAERDEARKGLVEVMEACVRFFRTQLRGGRAADARAYLERRGMDSAALERFEIGYAPADRQALATAMAQKGIDAEALVRAGMLIAPEDGGRPYDRFRDRIMFPIRDARDRCIAFGGRAMREDAGAKYINSPETELFDKGRSLYNHGPARAAAGRDGRLIVAEGYMDVIALVSAGFEAAAAPLGTAVTEEQLKLIWRMADEPVVALDGDRAGLKAARRLADLALPMLASGRSLRFCLLPEKMDPDDLIRSGGAAAMEQALSGALPLVEMLWRAETEGREFDSPERRAALDERLRALLRRIGDQGLRAHYGQAIKERREALFGGAPPRRREDGGRRFAKGGRRGFDGRAGFGFFEDAAPMPETRRTLLATPAEAGEARVRECALLWGALNHPALAEIHEETLRDLDFLNRDLRELRDAILGALPDALAAEAADKAGGEGGDEEAARAALLEAVTRGLGIDPLPFLSPGAVALTVDLGPAAAPARAALVFEEALSRHGLFIAALDEGRAGGDELSVETADAFTRRAGYMARRRDEASRQRAGETADAEDEEAVSARLRGFQEDRIWIRKDRRKSPRGA